MELRTAPPPASAGRVNSAPADTQGPMAAQATDLPPQCSKQRSRPDSSRKVECPHFFRPTPRSSGRPAGGAGASFGARSSGPLLNSLVGSPSMFRQLAIPWVLVPSVVLSVCQGPNYQAIATSPDVGAVIRAQQRDDRHQIRITVEVERVDGYFRYPAMQPAPLSSVLVDPGLRTVTVIGYEDSEKTFISTVPLPTSE